MAQGTLKPVSPADWAKIKSNLGAVYWKLLDGDRTANLQKAIAACEAALGVLNEKDSPDVWALAQINIGAAYLDLPTGDRTVNLQKAITACEAALRVKTEKEFPVAWADIEKRIESAKQQVLNKQASPLLFFMEYRLMDISILADYTGFWKWQIKRHLKPKVFHQLPAKKLEKYAAAFNIKVKDLKNMIINED